MLMQDGGFGVMWMAKRDLHGKVTCTWLVGALH